jgi:DNA-binding transcriptional MerR regulator
MRISDLSHATGVPIPTIKFYLRAGLLPTGQRTAPNQARYGEHHVRRLRLVRVLVEVGGLSLEAVRRVVAALERRDTPLHQALAEAHTALPGSPIPDDPRLRDARAETDAWLERLGWNLGEGNPARDGLAAALLALQELGWPVGPEVFERYARHADALAEAELQYVAAAANPERAVEATVIGTVIFERALVALRRLAQEHHSRERFGAD